MLRILALSAIVAATAFPVHAQDYTGNVNPSAWAGPTVMHGAINAQARRNGVRSRSGVTQAQINGCAQKSRFRAEYGADHPKIKRLYSLCRGLGL